MSQIDLSYGRVAFYELTDGGKSMRPCNRNHADIARIDFGDSCNVDLYTGENPGEFYQPNLDLLIRMFQKAHEAGQADARQSIRSALGIPNNWGGPMHGRSGT